MIKRYPLADQRVVAVGRSFEIDGLDIEAFAVEHSWRAPAVAYRIAEGTRCIFYAPDLISIRNEHAALQGVSLYIGDGARIERPLIRRRGRARIGHTSIWEQLEWCRRSRISRAIFTHCGREIVGGDGRRIARRIRALGKQFCVSARVARDGLAIAFDS